MTKMLVSALLSAALVAIAMGPVGAQTAHRRPALTGNVVRDVQAAVAPKGTSASPIQSIQDFLTKLANLGTADLQAADALASALDPDTQKMRDELGHNCYVAEIKFIGGLPAQVPGDQPGSGVIAAYERVRLIRIAVQNGIPSYLLQGCAPLWIDSATAVSKFSAQLGLGAINTAGFAAALGGL